MGASSARGAGRARAEAIARESAATVLEPGPLDALMTRIGDAGLVVGVDSGLTHLAGALGVPTVVLYGSTDPRLTGCRGSRVANVAAAFGCAPCLERICGYRGPAGRWRDEVVAPACYARLTPALVHGEAMRLVGGST